MVAPQYVAIEPIGVESLGTVHSRHGRCRYEGYPKVGGRRMVRADEGCLTQGFIECHEAHEVGTAFVWRGGKAQAGAHRLEEGRGGEEGKSRGGPGHLKKKMNDYSRRLWTDANTLI